jgi:predicted GNAT family N-acyltransferase
MPSSNECLLPSGLSKADFATCIALIKAGSAVNAARAERELPEAILVSILREDGRIVGVGVVKKQRPNYASSIASADKSGFKFDTSIHEIGYISVKQESEGRGHCQTLLRSLLQNFPARPVFATTYRPSMKHILGKFGFVSKGKEWEGTQGDMVSLWIKGTP